MKKLLWILLFLAAAAPGAWAQAGDTLWIVTPKSGAVKFSPDGRFIYVFTNTGVEKRDAATGNLVSEFTGYSNPNASGTSISTNCAKALQISDSLELWDMLKEELIWKIPVKIVPQGFVIKFACISADGNYAYLTIQDSVNTGNLAVLNLNSKMVEKVCNVPGELQQVVASPDGNYLAIGNKDLEKKFCRFTLWSTATMKPIKVIDSAYTLSLSKPCFSYDGKKFAYHIGTSNPYYASVYDIETGTFRRLADTNVTGINLFSRDNKFVIGASIYFAYDPDINAKRNLSCVQIASASDGRLKKRYFKLDCNGFDISPDNTMLIASGVDLKGPILVMLAPKFNELAVEDPPSLPKPYSFQTMENNINIIPDGNCNISNIEITNSVGQTQLSLTPAVGNISIDISGLLTGAYFCSITSGGNVFTEPFTIVR